MFNFGDTEARYHKWDGIMEESDYVEHGDQQVAQKHIKGARTTYKMCMDICERVGIASKHVKTMNKYRHIYKHRGCSMNLFWELLHGHIANTYNNKHESYQAIEKEGILEAMGQKIPLSHIEHLLRPYLEPKQEPIKFWKKKYDGLYITLNDYEFRRTPLPLEFKKALDALSIKYFDIENQPTFDSEIENWVDIMNEPNPPIDIPLFHDEKYQEIIDDCDRLLKKWEWVLG